MNVSARDLLKPRVHLEQWAWQLNRAFSSQEKWYLQKPLSGWNQKLCCRGDYPRRGGSARKSPRHYPALISGNSTCYIWWKASEYQMPDNDGMRHWSWTKGWSGEKWRSWQWWLPQCSGVLSGMSMCWVADTFRCWQNPGASAVLQFLYVHSESLVEKLLPINSSSYC